ncbi:GNAT family N-acetyltransferase [Streptomyces sp. NPDC003781]|uniref:GNAT family N-acetyltransferase n=1 Tax=Streptomyces sp. NPDC003781 TaxID=3364686 RepID=UPI0036860E53
MDGVDERIAAGGEQVCLVPRAEGDLWLLRRTNGPEATAHLGGPESEDQLLTRHRRYVRGLALRAARAVSEAARAAGSHRYLHAFPGVDHVASDAVCRGAGFTPLGQVDFEYPKGHWIRSNDWRVGLETGD